MVMRDVADGAREHHGAHNWLKIPMAPLARMTSGALGTFDRAENRQVAVETGAVLGLDVVAFAGSVRDQGGRAAPELPSAL